MLPGAPITKRSGSGTVPCIFPAVWLGGSFSLGDEIAAQIKYCEITPGTAGLCLLYLRFLFYFYF